MGKRALSKSEQEPKAKAKAKAKASTPVKAPPPAPAPLVKSQSTEVPCGSQNNLVSTQGLKLYNSSFLSFARKKTTYTP